MRRLLLIFAFILSVTLMSTAETYEITALTTPSITIGGKQLKVGGRFAGSDNIKWVDNDQSMEVKDLSTGSFHMFSRKVFESKGAILSVADYFLKTGEGSSRGENDKPLFSQSPVKANFPEKRIALIIGNSNYENLSYLRNAQKDASDIAETLKQLGFDVMEMYESTYSGMKTALNNFASRSRNYDVALFYYAGHGIQEGGENYLVPIERELKLPSEVGSCLNCDDVIKLMGAPARLMFIDACRHTKKSWSRDAAEGLARMEGPVGSVILFSTQSGNVALDALDGSGQNSPFAQSLIKNIRIPDISFNDAIDGVVRDTYSLTGARQCPMKIGTLLNRFSFNSPARGSASAPAVDVDEQLQRAIDLYDKKDYAKALPIFRTLAEKGNPEAQYRLGVSYEYSRGVEQNYAEALKWYLKSAGQGNEDAQYRLGSIYEKGKGNVEQNYAEALKWYRKSADQGNAGSQNNLGNMYFYGHGVEQDYSEAVKLYRKSADQGNYAAQSNLGNMYYNGQGVPQNFAEALKWYRKSADQGYDGAQNSLGNMYYYGYGIGRNFTEAMKWFRKSAEQENENAQYNLGVMYLNGDDVEIDYDEGYKWMVKAAENGHKSAKKWLEKNSAAASDGGNFTVSGKVVDESNDGLIGATVRMVDRLNVTSTDINGNFTLKDVPEGAEIEVSYVGYKPVKMKVTSRNASGIVIKLAVWD